MFLEMAVSIGASGGITRNKAEGYITIRLEICIKVSSGMDINMVKDITCMQLVIFTKKLSVRFEIWIGKDEIYKQR